MLTPTGSPEPDPPQVQAVPSIPRRSDPLAASLALMLALADLVAGGNGVFGLTGLPDTATALPRAAFVVPVLVLLRELIMERDSGRLLPPLLLALAVADAAWSLSDALFGVMTAGPGSGPLPPVAVAFLVLLLLTRFVAGALSIAVAILLFARPELGPLLLGFGVCSLLAGFLYVTVFASALGPFSESVGAVLLTVLFLRRPVATRRA